MHTKSLFYTATASQAAVITEGVAVSSTNVYRSAKFNNHVGLTKINTEWTGDADGTLVIQESNELAPVESTDADWVDSAADVDGPGGTPGSAMADFTSQARWIRVKYTNATGSGTLISRFSQADV